MPASEPSAVLHRAGAGCGRSSGARPGHGAGCSWSSLPLVEALLMGLASLRATVLAFSRASLPLSAGEILGTTVTTGPVLWSYSVEVLRACWSIPWGHPCLSPWAHERALTSAGQRDARWCPPQVLGRMGTEWWPEPLEHLASCPRTGPQPTLRSGLRAGGPPRVSAWGSEVLASSCDGRGGGCCSGVFIGV